MPTAVLDLDLQRLPPVITVPDQYDRALVLIRFRGQPVGQALLPVVEGRLADPDLPTRLVEAAGLPLQERWLRDYLEWDDIPTDAPLASATVAVCTRDRPHDLECCLEALRHLPNDGQEVLVVDNCPSTDATQRIVAKNGGRVRYVREERPGLDVARNRALFEARHEVVAFIDDDAAPDPGWLRALVRNFNDPRVLCVTGLTMPLELETEAQQCFEQHSTFGRGFRRTIFERFKGNPMAVGRIGVGVNMALHRRVTDLIGPFDEALGVGTLTRSGGDYEMFSRILASGYRIVYDPAALSWHRHRRTWDEVRRAFYGYGVGVYAAWTRSLLVERELSVFKPAWQWLSHVQLPELLRSVGKRPNSMPLDVILAQLRGCAVGPWAYLASRRQLRQTEWNHGRRTNN